MNNYGIIIQCRDNAVRFKNKSVRPFYKGKSILEVIYERLIVLKSLIVIATSYNSPKTIEICKKLNAKYYVGSEDNVTQRLYLAAKRFGFDGFFRVCADNPFIQISLLQILSNWINDGYDYIAYKDSMRRHEGFFTEFVRTKVLQDTLMETELAYELEHVTPFVIRQPKRYKQAIIRVPRLMGLIPIRLTVDTEGDFLNAQDVYKHAKYYTWGDIIEYIYQNPKLLKRMEKLKEENMK